MAEHPTTKQGRAPVPAYALPLRGMGTLYGDLDQALSRIRTRQAELVQVKQAALRTDTDSL